MHRRRPGPLSPRGRRRSWLGIVRRWLAHGGHRGRAPRCRGDATGAGGPSPAGEPVSAATDARNLSPPRGESHAEMSTFPNPPDDPPARGRDPHPDRRPPRRRPRPPRTADFELMLALRGAARARDLRNRVVRPRSADSREAAAPPRRPPIRRRPAPRSRPSRLTERVSFLAVSHYALGLPGSGHARRLPGRRGAHPRGARAPRARAPSRWPSSATRRCASASARRASAPCSATPRSSSSGSPAPSPPAIPGQVREWADWVAPGLPPPQGPDGRPRDA